MCFPSAGLARSGDDTQEAAHLVHLLSCGAQLGGHDRRCYFGPNFAAAAAPVAARREAFWDDQASLGREVGAEGEEVAPLLRYTLRIASELFVGGLRVGGVLAVEGLVVHPVSL